MEILTSVAFILCLIALPCGAEKADNVKMCVIPTSSQMSKLCDALAQSKDSPVSCVYGVDRLDCLRAVSERNADMTVLEPEDLFAATLWPETSLLVASEIRADLKREYSTGIVLVVGDRVPNTGPVRARIRGHRLCHSGNLTSFGWDHVFSRYLEEMFAPRSCDEDVTVLEDQMKATSEYFGESCFAGPWSEDQEEDIRLKLEYSKMCALCWEGDCGNSEKYGGFAGSILCLADGVGDVLWTSHEIGCPHLKRLATDARNLSLLCEDGSRMALEAPEPCLWVAKPWQVIASNPKSLTSVQKIFHDIGDKEWERNLMSIAFPYMEPYFVNAEAPKTPQDYLMKVPGYLRAQGLVHGNCNLPHRVRLCTSSLAELKKCTWLSRAAVASSLNPELECMKSSSLLECMTSVAQGTSDVVVVPADYAFDAITKYNLSDVYRECPSRVSEGYLASAVTREGSKVKQFDDLEGTRACFTREGGVGWASVLMALRDKHDGDDDSECWRERGGKDVMLSFFSDVCVANVDGGDSGVPACESRNNVTSSDDVSAVQSLLRNRCDVAFVDETDLRRHPEVKTSKLKSFRRLCRGKDANCKEYWVHPSYVMMSTNASSVKFLEVKSLLNMLDRAFGGKSNEGGPLMFQIFGSFEGVPNVLFRDTSKALKTPQYCLLGEAENDFMSVPKTVCSGAWPTLADPSRHLLLLVVVVLLYTTTGRILWK